MKVVQTEPESDALRCFLRRHRHDVRVASELARVEVVRAVSGGGPAAVEHARRQLARLAQIKLDRELLDAASTLLTGRALRSLDAIHLAAARSIGDDLRSVVSYDHRMQEAARELGMTVAAPA